MKKSKDIDQLAAALVQVQGHLKPMVRDRTGKIEGQSKKSGNEYSFSFPYTAYAEMKEIAQPLLTAAGLAVSQGVDEQDDIPMLETLLMHASGQWILFRQPMTATADRQNMGGQITHFSRYGFKAVVGIVSEEREETNAPPQGQRRAQPPAPATAQTLKSFLAEARPLFGELTEEQRGKVLKPFSGAKTLEEVSPPNRERLLHALRDLHAAKR